MNIDENDSDLTASGERSWIDLGAASELTGLRTEVIVELTRAEVVVAADPDPEEPRFDEVGLIRLRQIAGLQHSENVSHRVLRLIMDLMDRLERAEEELRFRREQAGGGRGDSGNR